MLLVPYGWSSGFSDSLPKLKKCPPSVPNFQFSLYVLDESGAAKCHMIPNSLCLSAVTVETGPGMCSGTKLIVGC